MEAGSRNHLALIVGVVIIMVAVFAVLPDNDYAVFGAIMLFALSIMAHFPEWTYHQLQIRMKTSLRQSEVCRGMTEKERNKRFELGMGLNKAVKDLISVAIFLSGLAAAFIFTDTNFAHEYSYGEFTTTPARILVSCAIFSLAVIMRIAVPLFLVKVINDFGRQLRTLEAKERAMIEGTAEEPEDGPVAKEELPTEDFKDAEEEEKKAGEDAKAEKEKPSKKDPKAAKEGKA